jgi:hypothetical protein
MNEKNKYFIQCSYGEIIDKYTILKIKLSKSTDEKQTINIKTEFDELQKYIKNDDILYDKLFEINKKLWILEDTIRYKSDKKEFDKLYIDCAEKIHITNDERYNIKKKINEKYNSHIIEEKIYKNEKYTNKEVLNNNTISNNDEKKLEQATLLFSMHKIKESYSILCALVNNYENCNIVNYFTANLFFSFHICQSTLGLEITHKTNIENIINNIDNLENSDLKKYINNQTCLYFLLIGEYKKSYPYLKYINPAEGPFNININTISYLDDNDINKIMLFYSSGGIGDIIMFSRFIPEYCYKHKNNKILYCIKDSLYWLFKKVFNNIDNLLLFPFSKSIEILNKYKFNHHTNITEIFKLLDKGYDDIKNNNYLKDITGSDIDINNIIHKNKKNIIINWKGNKNNPHEIFNRGMNLSNLSKIFNDNKNINFISVQKDLNDTEKKLLKKYNVVDLSNIIDNNNKTFYDTITIFKNVDCVISTDTSLLHLSGSMNINTIALLTIGCEWRWTRNNHTNWYSKIKIIKQIKYNSWDEAINNLNDFLINNY